MDAFETLFKIWSSIHAEMSASDLADETCYRSLCIGWCMAKGMTPDEGYDFYQKCISKILVP